MAISDGPFDVVVFKNENGDRVDRLSVNQYRGEVHCVASRQSRRPYFSSKLLFLKDLDLRMGASMCGGSPLPT